jgi:hypothetical protein
VALSPIFICDDPRDVAPVRRVLRRLPPLEGLPVRLQRSAGLCDRGREVHAGSFIRERRIALNCTRAEFARILVHETFHFVWARAANALRWSYEELLQSEQPWKSGGELGWSAAWRKARLSERDAAARTRRWREYCCESFCDTAARVYSGIERHDEYALGGAGLRRRRAWFRDNLSGLHLPI